MGALLVNGSQDIYTIMSLQWTIINYIKYYI